MPRILSPDHHYLEPMEITKDAITLTWDEVMDVLEEHHNELCHEVTDAVYRYCRYVINSIGYHPSQQFRYGEKKLADTDVEYFGWDEDGYSHYILSKAECDNDSPIDFRYQPEETCLLKSGRERIWVDENGDLLPKQQAGNND